VTSPYFSNITTFFHSRQVLIPGCAAANGLAPELLKFKAELPSLSIGELVYRTYLDMFLTPYIHRKVHTPLIPSKLASVRFKLP
jgi:hypothetical protein